MAHTIIAYGDTIQIARLEFGATNHAMAGYSYKVLNAEEYNNGVSGNGESKIYSYENILKAKAALIYYETEPFEIVRNTENELKAELFISSLPGISPTGQEHFSRQEISEGISRIREFLETILKAAPATKFEINFG